MRPMTPMQHAVHLVIRNRQVRHEPGPTLDEIATAIGVSKVRVVQLVAVLEGRGALEWPKGPDGRRLARSLRVARSDLGA